MRLVRNGGRAALLGIPSDDVTLNLAERIIFKGLTVLGINGRKMFETWYQTRGAGPERARRPRADHHARAALEAVRARLRADASRRSAPKSSSTSKGESQSHERDLRSEAHRDLDALRAAGTYKRLRHLTTPMAPHVHMEEAGDVIVLSSNNYLGLADHPDVIEAGIEGCDKYGAGTASVRFICGTFDIHRVLEERIAAFFGTRVGAVVRLVLDRERGLLADDRQRGQHAHLRRAQPRLDHRRLPARPKAKRLRYKHGDMADLEAKLQEARGRTVVIVTDGVFSMEGRSRSCPRSSRWPSATTRSRSSTTGTAPASWARPGRGTIEHFGLEGQVDILTGTLGKALGGAAGGFVAGSDALIDMLIQRSRTQLFSNALPATVACSALAAIESWKRIPSCVAAAA